MNSSPFVILFNVVILFLFCFCFFFSEGRGDDEDDDESEGEEGGEEGKHIFAPRVSGLRSQVSGFFNYRT